MPSSVHEYCFSPVLSSRAMVIIGGCCNLGTQSRQVIDGHAAEEHLDPILAMLFGPAVIRSDVQVFVQSSFRVDVALATKVVRLLATARLIVFFSSSSAAMTCCTSSLTMISYSFSMITGDLTPPTVAPSGRFRSAALGRTFVAYTAVRRGRGLLRDQVLPGLAFLRSYVRFQPARGLTLGTAEAAAGPVKHRLPLRNSRKGAAISFSPGA